MSTNVDFEKLLAAGKADIYDSQIGTWWLSQCSDQDHLNAYTNIVQTCAQYYRKNNLPDPKFIVDYACGSGELMILLNEVFPHSTIIGVDGSDKLLNAFVARSDGKASITQSEDLFTEDGSQFRLFCSKLPNFEIPQGKADLAILCFPNLITDDDSLDLFNDNGYADAQDNDVAGMLARFREMDPEDEVDANPDKEDIFDDLMTARVYANNIRKFLNDSGVFVQVDYANAPREELTDLVQWRCLFSECALERPIKDEESTVLFGFDESSYTDSPVIMDVFHQTGDPTDKEGGYHINIFKAQ
ncbi:MAG: class I SAM-dependent methyltransferase [Fibrobacterales bacterium]